MSKPYIHAKSSARRFGGRAEDYEEIHNFLDSSKAAFPSNIHRVLTHQSWFIFQVLERIKFHNSCPCTPDNRFPLIINSDGKEVSVRDIGEQHILEDFKNRFIPTVADYLNNMEWAAWMDNGKDVPPSFEKIYKNKKKDKTKVELDPQTKGILEELEKAKPISGKDFIIDGSNFMLEPVPATKVCPKIGEVFYDGCDGHCRDQRTAIDPEIKGKLVD